MAYLFFHFGLFYSYGVKTRTILYFFLKKKGSLLVCQVTLYASSNMCRGFRWQKLPSVAVLERSRRLLPNEVGCVVVCQVIWLRRYFLSFFSFSLFALENVLSNKTIHVILLFCLDIRSSSLVFYCMIFVLISFVNFKCLFDFIID